MKKESLRKAYGQALVELGASNPDIVALEADLGKSTMSYLFKQAYPERFFEMGIAEQNMTSTAAGLALAGKIPFVSTFAVFASGRAYDQIRCSIAIAKAKFDALPEGHKEIIRKAAQESALFQREQITKMESEQVAKLKELGMEVTTPDVTPFREATKAVYDEFKSGRVVSRVTSDTHDFANVVTLVLNLLITGGSDYHGGFAGRALGVPVVDSAYLRLGKLEALIMT
mgnify:CR=1 FL=1